MKPFFYCIFIFSVAVYVEPQTVKEQPSAGEVNGCPLTVQEIGTQATKNNWIFVKFRNDTQKEIVGELFALTFFDSVQEPEQALTDYPADQKAKPGESKKAWWKDPLDIEAHKSEWRRRQFDAAAIEVLFADGSKWKDDGSKSCVLKHTVR